MKEALGKNPELDQMYDSLAEIGDQFPDRQGVAQLDELTYEHPRKGTKPIEVDELVLAAAQSVHTQDPALHDAFARRSLPVDGFAAAQAIVGERMQQGLVWGFSGYTTPGRSYRDEANGMTCLYDHLTKIDAIPSLVIDGGMSEGALGLSGILAKKHDVQSMGFAPLQGLGNIGTRDNLVVWGDTYDSREAAVGTVPDILVCMGGGDGTRRECEAALKNGSSVLLLALKPGYRDGSFPKTYDTFEEIQKGLQDGRMRVCTSPDEIATNVDALLQNDFQAARAGRASAIAEIFSQKEFTPPNEYKKPIRQPEGAHIEKDQATPQIPEKVVNATFSMVEEAMKHASRRVIGEGKNQRLSDNPTIEVSFRCADDHITLRGCPNPETGQLDTVQFFARYGNFYDLDMVNHTVSVPPSDGRYNYREPFSKMAPGLDGWEVGTEITKKRPGDVGDYEVIQSTLKGYEADRRSPGYPLIEVLRPLPVDTPKLTKIQRLGAALARRTVLPFTIQYERLGVENIAAVGPHFNSNEN